MRDQTVNQPWLLKPTGDNGEFVLGLASASTVEEDGSRMMLKNAQTFQHTRFWMACLSIRRGTSSSRSHTGRSNMLLPWQTNSFE